MMTIFLGYVPNIAHPRSFNEKITHRKLLEHDPRFQNLADKWAVREYVATVVGKQYLNQVFAVISSVSELKLDTLPDRFVVKPNHYSGQIYFISDKSALDASSFARTLDGWLSSKYGVDQGEYWYAQIPPRIIFEEWLTQDGHRVAMDLKFYVFHGRVEAIHVNFDRFFGRHAKNFYSREWHKLPVKLYRPNETGAGLERPARLDDMIAIAEALGRDFDFVRVDLYCIDDARILFGEMTFAPDGGHGRYTPRTFDFELGKFW